MVWKTQCLVSPWILPAMIGKNPFWHLVLILKQPCFSDAHWEFLWVCLSAQLPLLGGLQRASVARLPKAKSPLVGIKGLLKLQRLKGEEGKHRMLTLPFFSISMPLIHIREYLKRLWDLFPLELKVKCGIAPLGPKIRKRESDTRASYCKGGQPSPWWKWDSQIRPGNSREGWTFESHSSQRLGLHWGRCWSSSDVKKPKPNKIDWLHEI